MTVLPLPHDAELAYRRERIRADYAAGPRVPVRRGRTARPTGRRS